MTTTISRPKVLCLAGAVALMQLPTSARADSIVDRQAQVDALLKEVAALEENEPAARDASPAAPTAPSNVVTGGATKGSFKLPGSNTSATLGAASPGRPTGHELPVVVAVLALDVARIGVLHGVFAEPGRRCRHEPRRRSHDGATQADAGPPEGRASNDACHFCSFRYAMMSARDCASSILKNILVPGTSALGLVSQRSSVVSFQVIPDCALTFDEKAQCASRPG
jgi:hypothetical protein